MLAEPNVVKVRLLLVDDIPANLVALEAVLDRPDYELVRAPSGAAALRELETGDFAVILLDVQMPIMDGFEVATKIKADPRFRFIPIIFLTAIDHTAARVTLAYKTGAVDFIQKPFVPEILRAKVSVFVDLYRAKDQSRRQESELREAHTSLIDREQKIREQADSLASSLEESGRLKHEFLTTLGRELRTPLNSIVSWTRMLRDGSVRESQRDRALETVERNAGSQLDLIEELIDMSWISSGTLALVLGSADVVSLVQGAIDTARPAVREKKIIFHSAVARDIAPIHGDADRLRQIVSQLIANAVKATPVGGSITVSLSKSRSQIELSVEDSGLGIEIEELPTIFDGHDTKGGAVKLAIVRHLVELHEGTIRAESQGKGLGSQFYVRLPVAGLPDVSVA